MGLKSGSRDSGLDDTEQDQQAEKPEQESTDADQTGEDGETQSPEDDSTSPQYTEEPDSATTEATGPDSEPTAAPPADSIPYKLRRTQVNEGREQVPYFLRSEVIDGETDLKKTLEAELGETVYKSDYREAAMVVAQRQPELVAEILREWGYDFGTK